MNRREALLLALMPAGQALTSGNVTLRTIPDPPWVIHLAPTITVVRGNRRVTFTADEILDALQREDSRG